MATRRFELQNLVTDPATDDELVASLIAVANGAELVIVGQPTLEGEQYSEPHSSENDVELYASFLQGVIDHPKGLLPMLTDGSGRPRPTMKAIRFQERAEAVCADSLPAPLRALTSLARAERLFVARARGYSLRYFHAFPDAATALANAAAMVLDIERPYGREISRCKLCRGFYRAHQNPKGGPLNRTYCSAKHREIYNNSAHRKHE